MPRTEYNVHHLDANFGHNCDKAEMFEVYTKICELVNPLNVGGLDRNSQLFKYLFRLERYNPSVVDYEDVFVLEINFTELEVRRISLIKSVGARQEL